MAVTLRLLNILNILKGLGLNVITVVPPEPDKQQAEIVNHSNRETHR